MPNCIVCGAYSTEHMHFQLEPATAHRYVRKVVDLIKNQLEVDERRLEQPEFMLFKQNVFVPYICQLDWYAIMANGNEYAWDGVNLLVFSPNDGEYHEWQLNEYHPSIPSQIMFKRDERSGKWCTMPA